MDACHGCALDIKQTGRGGANDDDFAGEGFARLLWLGFNQLAIDIDKGQIAVGKGRPAPVQQRFLNWRTRPVELLRHALRQRGNAPTRVRKPTRVAANDAVMVRVNLVRTQSPVVNRCGNFGQDDRYRLLRIGGGHGGFQGPHPWQGPHRNAAEFVVLWIKPKHGKKGGA